MFNVKKGEKYVVAIYKGENVYFKEVICEGEITNFQIPQLEIETTDGEYYPLGRVYKNLEEAQKEVKKNAKRIIKLLKRELKDKYKEIEELKKEIEKQELNFNNLNF